jgi:hypothetical protein
VQPRALRIEEHGRDYFYLRIAPAYRAVGKDALT